MAFAVKTNPDPKYSEYTVQVFGGKPRRLLLVWDTSKADAERDAKEHAAAGNYVEIKKGSKVVSTFGKRKLTMKKRNAEKGRSGLPLFGFQLKEGNRWFSAGKLEAENRQAFIEYLKSKWGDKARIATDRMMEKQPVDFGLKDYTVYVNGEERGTVAARSKKNAISWVKREWGVVRNDKITVGPGVPRYPAKKNPELINADDSRVVRFMKAFHEAGRADWQKRHPGAPYHSFDKYLRAVQKQKYINIDQDSSALFMIDRSSGVIYGTKGYGQVDKRKRYGTIDTALKNPFGIGRLWKVEVEKPQPAGTVLALTKSGAISKASKENHVPRSRVHVSRNPFGLMTASEALALLGKIRGSKNPAVRLKNGTVIKGRHIKVFLTEHARTNPTRRNIQWGFYKGGQFHPIRASVDYSPDSVGESFSHAPTSRSAKRLMKKIRAGGLGHTKNPGKGFRMYRISGRALAKGYNSIPELALASTRAGLKHHREERPEGPRVSFTNSIGKVVAVFQGYPKEPKTNPKSGQIAELKKRAHSMGVEARGVADWKQADYLNKLQNLAADAGGKTTYGKLLKTFFEAREGRKMETPRTYAKKNPKAGHLQKTSYSAVKNYQRFTMGPQSSTWYVKTPSGYKYEGMSWLIGDMGGSNHVWVEPAATNPSASTLGSIPVGTRFRFPKEKTIRTKSSARHYTGKLGAVNSIMNFKSRVIVVGKNPAKGKKRSAFELGKMYVRAFDQDNRPLMRKINDQIEQLARTQSNAHSEALRGIAFQKHGVGRINLVIWKEKSRWYSQADTPGAKPHQTTFGDRVSAETVKKEIRKSQPGVTVTLRKNPVSVFPQRIVKTTKKEAMRTGRTLYVFRNFNSKVVSSTNMPKWGSDTLLIRPDGSSAFLTWHQGREGFSGRYTSEVFEDAPKRNTDHEKGVKWLQGRIRDREELLRQGRRPEPLTVHHGTQLHDDAKSRPDLFRLSESKHRGPGSEIVFVYPVKNPKRNLDHRDAAHPIEVSHYWQGRKGYLTPWQRAHQAGQMQLFTMNPARARRITFKGFDGKEYQGLYIGKVKGLHRIVYKVHGKFGGNVMGLLNDSEYKSRVKAIRGASANPYLMLVNGKYRFSGIPAGVKNPKKNDGVFEKFHGMPSTRVDEVDMPDSAPKNTERLGDMICIFYQKDGEHITPAGSKAEGKTKHWIDFPKGVYVDSNRAGNHYFFVARAGCLPQGTPNHIFGPATRIEYGAAKPHIENGSKDKKPYYHAFGEEDGKRPILRTDHEGHLILEKGNYRTEWSGINN